MSSHSPAATESAARIKALLDAALPAINADIDRFGDVLQTWKWNTAAFGRIQRRISDLRSSLRALNSQHPALEPAVSGVTSLAHGLVAFDRARKATNDAAAAQATKEARALFERSSTALLAVDRALGCPYGCRKPRSRP